jgi:adenosine deaminase
MITTALLAALPKTDLHIHLDGSLRVPTLIELAKAQGVELPSYTEEGLRELVFKDQYKDLPDYLHGFMYTCAVLRDPEALERVSYELAHDNMDEGVRYIEVRFAPQLNTTADLDIRGVLQCVHKGLDRAASEINQRPGIASGTEPPFHFGLIGCAMRKFTAGFSPYFRQLFDVHPYATPEQIYTMASDEVVRALVRARDEDGVAVVGFDLAGEEKGYPAGNHVQAFQYAHAHFLKKTVHAGEAYGPNSIYQAVADCHADRIGHGTHLFREDLVDLPEASERAQFVEQLAGYIADQRVTIEVCLTSNMQTMPEIGTLTNHPFAQMEKARLSTTFCTDNRLVSNTTVTKEIDLAVQHFTLDATRLRHLIVYGFKRSFFPGSYREKRQYVRKVIDYYQQVEKSFA